MYEQLKEIYKGKILSSIYSDKNDCDKFSVGYIMSLTTEFILIQHFNPHGGFDGYSVRQIDDIYRIETNSKYLKTIEQLIDCRKSEQTFEISFNGNLLINIISFSLENSKIVSIDIDADSDNIIGYVKFIKSETIGIYQVSDYGEEDGETTILIENIKEVCMGNLNTSDLEFLYNNLHK